jgi:signal transduction histidine kinase
VTRGIRPILLLTIAVAGGATVVVATVPSLSFAYRGGDARVALETSATLITALAAFLLLGRLRESGSRAELMLFIGLLLLTLSNLVRAVAPNFTGENHVAIWVPLVTRVIAAGTLAAAPFVSTSRIRERQRLPFLVVVPVVVVVVVAALVASFTAGLDTGVRPSISPQDAKDARIVGSAALLVTMVAVIVLFSVSSWGFASRARRTGDELLGWLALAMAFAALARLNYFLFPSVYTDWVFTGDILQLGTYGLILAGALREIARYQRRAAHAAVFEERGRIARDLHDGLAQDLAYIRMQGERLAAVDDRGAKIAAAAEDALIHSRGMIASLIAADARLGDAVASLSRALADRHGVDLVLDVDEQLDARAAERDDLLGIISEGISNAVRHGEASQISIRLARGDEIGLRLTISDNGGGFDPVEAGDGNGGGLGLRGMRERAERMGGRLEVSSSPGIGTTLEVEL